MTGVIFAVYAVASVMSSLVIGMYMDQIGHRCVILFGTLLMAVSIASFGVIEDLTDYTMVLSIAITSRCFEGAASGLMNTAVYSYTALAYPENVEKVISLSEGFVGIGCTMGPVLGSLVYNAVGFSWTFYIFGLAMLPFALLVCCCMKEPNAGEEEQGEEEDGLNDPVTHDGQDYEGDAGVTKITYGRLFCNMKVLFAALTGCMLAIVYGANEPILSLRLDDYNLDSTQTGLVFGMYSIFYMISTFLVPYIVPDWVEPRVTLITSAFLLVFSTALVGPFYTDKSLVAMLIGLASSGFFISFMIVPNMTEMMAAVQEAYPSFAGTGKTNSMLSGLLNSSYALG